MLSFSLHMNEPRFHNEVQSNSEMAYLQCRIKARINGFNISPAFVQQKLNGYWSNVGQMLFKRLQRHLTFSRTKEMLCGC